MAFVEFKFLSETIRKQTAAHVILPDKGKGPFPVFYLLHGQSDDHTTWHRRTRIEWYVRDLPLIVVMPDGDRGFYTDNEEGPAYARYFGEELPAIIERSFHAKATRTARCIGGLSMGGYGALRIALAYPEKFVSATSHSGALMVGTYPHNNGENEEFIRIFGGRPHGTSHDLTHLAELASKSKHFPKLKIDCGTEDFLLGQNRHFHKQLTAAKIPHQYDEFPGEHHWDYWDEHIRDAIAFHAKVMKLAPAKARR